MPLDTVAAAEVATLIEEGYSQDLLMQVAQGSTAMQAFGSVPIGNRVTHYPVLSSMPEAKWVAGETNIRSKSVAKWVDTIMRIEEVSVIIPVAEATIEDASAALLDNIAQVGGQSLATKLDMAVLFGIEKPGTWASPGLLPAAIAAAQTMTPAAGAGEDDLAGAIFQMAEKVDDVGFDPSSFTAAKGTRFKLANLRDTQGRPLLGTTTSGNNTADDVAGLPAKWAVAGSWDRTQALAIIADGSRVKIGVRSDVSVKFLDQATLTQPDGTFINLAETDQVALKIKARFGYVLGRSATNESRTALATPVAAVLPYAVAP